MQQRRPTTATKLNKQIKLKKPQCPLTDEWVKKMCTYIQRNTTHPLKRVKLPFAATWIDLEIIIVSEVSLTDKDKYHDITYTQKVKKKGGGAQINLFTKQKQRIYGYQQGREAERDRLGAWD